MKKLLALVLALVMTMSLVTISNAAFSDADKIDNKEAVDVMAAVGVLAGYTDGSFGAKDTLTRAQAAKIIAYLDLGQEAADALVGTGAVFSDVAANNWAAGFIEYCAQAGYVSGIGDGKFAPNEQVTGLQFAKMLLGVLGYNASIESMTGADWSISVAKLAAKNDLFDEVSGSTNVALTREKAAQVAFNALQATMVEYDTTGTTVKGDGFEVVTGASKADKVASTLAKDYRTGTDRDEYQQLCEKLYGTKLKLQTAGTDDLKRTTQKWTYKNEDVATKITAADATFVSDGSKDFEEVITEDMNYVHASGVSTTYMNGNDTLLSLAATETPGAVVEIYTNDDGKVSKVVSYTYTLVKVDEVTKYDDDEDGAKKFGATKYYGLTDLEGNALGLTVANFTDTLNAKGEDEADYQAIGDFAEGDVFAAVIAVNGTKIVKVAPVTSVNGKLTAAKDGQYIKVDGTQYTDATGVKNTELDETLNYDDTYTFYLDPNGVVIGAKVKESGEVDKYAYVLEAEAETSSLISGGDKAVVKVVYTDGTVSVVNYALTKANKAYTVPAGRTAIAKGDMYFTFDGTKYNVADFETIISGEGWFAYSLNSDKEITLKAASSDTVGLLAATVEKDVKTINTAGTVYVSSKTELVVFDKSGIAKTYTGYANFPADALTGDEASLVIYTNSDKNTAATIYLFKTDFEASTKVDAVMFVSKGDTTKDGIVCTFYQDGKKVTYTVDADDALLASASAGDLFEITVTDDIATLGAAGEARGTVTVVSDDYVGVNGTIYELTSDCAVYAIARDGKSLTSASFSTKDGNDVIDYFVSSGKIYLAFIRKGL